MLLGIFEGSIRTSTTYALFNRAFGACKWHALKNGTTKSEPAYVRYRLSSCHQQVRSGRSGTETENRSDGGAIPAGPEEPLEDARLDTQRWRRGLREPRTGQPEPGSWSNGFGSNAEAWQIYCTSIRFHYGETEPAQSISVAPSQTREHISSCRGPIDDAPSVIVPIHTYGVSVHSFIRLLVDGRSNLRCLLGTLTSEYLRHITNRSPGADSKPNKPNSVSTWHYNCGFRQHVPGGNGCRSVHGQD
ncbi:hypothetical protein GQ607_009589 [Colletotrichum asianum]|uniref:Uncharacterized protein n=1 Tax=Colletotrichum asianum TaxID=702518 RepID=A0A8H3WBD0_9PEZI|nr:hypothetical protein GQ607_009589 [Colletotrichum asianum]